MSDDLSISIGDEPMTIWAGDDPDVVGVEIVEKGDKGDPGEDGSDDKTFRHVQDIPNQSVTIVHGLGKYPAVTIKDTAGTQIEAEITFIDINTIHVALSANFAWTADLN
jgi:hypothetical protein